jgi:hypothetical protein
MKRFLLLLPLCGMVWTGCGRQDSTTDGGSTNAAGGNPLTAPVDYLGAAAKAKRSSEKVIDTVALSQAIQLFHASEGRYPKDLQELVTERYLPKVPDAPHGMKITYDAATGQARIVPQ